MRDKKSQLKRARRLSIHRELSLWTRYLLRVSFAISLLVNAAGKVMDSSEPVAQPPVVIVVPSDQIEDVTPAKAAPTEDDLKAI